MKKTCFYLLSIVLSLTAHAHDNDGVLSVTNLSRQRVLIEVDGRQYSDCNNALTLRDIITGVHFVKVYTEKTMRGSPNRWQMIYNRNLYIKAKYYVDIIINRFGHALIDEQPITDDRYDENTCNDRDARDDRNNRPGRDNSIPKPMTDDMFASFMETIKSEHFDDGRMAITKSFVDQNYFTAAQAKQLTGLFTFESNKLEMAKYMYGKTTDRKNYFIVYSAFTFSNTKDDLAEYIRNFK